jgi:hypothetical protein
MDELKGSGALEALRQHWAGVSLGDDELSRHVAQLGVSDALPRDLPAVYICAVRRVAARLRAAHLRAEARDLNADRGARR